MARNLHELYDINVLGTFSFKGTTLEARFGNPTPRIAECTAGMINAVGLQNPGVHHVIEHELPELKTFFHKKVIANISGFSVAEYEECCRLIDQQEQVGLIEVNVSCPNVHGGGMAFGTCAESAAEVTRAVKAVTTKPVYIKLSPNVTDIVSIAKACEDAGADGLSLINTLLGMRIDLKTRKPVIANVMGGFSGPAVFPVALRMVYQVARGGEHPRDRHGRREQRARRDRNDAGRGDRRAGGRSRIWWTPTFARRSSRRCPARWSAWASNAWRTLLEVRGNEPREM